MFKIFSAFLVVITTINTICSAQVAFQSLEDVWKYADEHNITIHTAQYEADKATLAKKQSYGALLPQATLTGSFTDNLSLQTTLIPAVIFGGPEGTYQPVQFGQKYIYLGGFSAQMDLVNLQSWMNVQIARATEQYNNASLANTRKTVYQQIATQYYSYLLMQEAARLAAQSTSIADSVLQSMSNKFKEGTVNAANVDAAKINYERAQQNQVTAQYQMQTAMNNLKALLNLSIKDSITFAAALQKDAAIAADAAFHEDPAIRLSYTQAQISLGQYRASRMALLPTLTVLYSNTTQQNDNKFEPLNNGPAWYPAQYWSLRATWSIFNGGSRYYQLKRNKLSYDEGMQQYEQAKKQSEINDENIRLSYQKAFTVYHKSENVMNLALDNYEHMSYRYEAGIEPIESRLNAFKDYIDYQNQYLNSLSDMLVQLYQLKIRQQAF